MRAPKQNCPRCEAEQSFRPRTREIDGRPGVIQVFIRCTVCRWDSVLRVSTPGIEKLMRNRSRMLQRRRLEQERYGNPTGSTLLILREIDADLARQREKLRDD